MQRLVIITFYGYRTLVKMYPLTCERTVSVAEFLRLLIFSALNRSSSLRCAFEPSSGHMVDKPSSACGWSGVFFSRDLPFLPHLTINSAQNQYRDNRVLLPSLVVSFSSGLSENLGSLPYLRSTLFPTLLEIVSWSVSVPRLFEEKRRDIVFGFP